MSRQQKHYYSDFAEDIPLGQVPSTEEKYDQKLFDSRQQQPADSTAYARQSVNRNKKTSSLSLYSKALFNIVLSGFFTIALLLLFIYADGKPLDSTIIGLKIPSLVSFLLSANLIFIASGISKYDSCKQWIPGHI